IDHLLYFFFQAEDGIRDRNVTGVQTCALPISCRRGLRRSAVRGRGGALTGEGSWRERGILGLAAVGADGGQVCFGRLQGVDAGEIGRASCRGRGERTVGGW